MGKLILVTGGARSGKSGYAEEMLLEKNHVCYVATNAVAVDDQEMQHRIQLHQERRPKNWDTVEQFVNLDQVFLKPSKKYDGYLVDCVTMQVTNFIFNYFQGQYGNDFEKIDKKIATLSETEKDKIEHLLLDEWKRTLIGMQQASGDVVVVTNELGSGIVPENSFSRWYRDMVGRVNQFLGKEATHLYLVVCGVPTKIK